MSTKHETTTTNQYDSQSMNNYHQNNSGATNVFSDYMKDPLKASYFLNQVGILNRVSNQIGQRNIGNLLNNQQMTGGGVMPGYMSSMLARTGRDTGAMQSQNFLGALMQAESNRRGAANMAIQDRPLQTGQKSVEQTSGLGTWLPQVAGMAAGAALAPFTGGASLMGSMGAMKGLGGGGGGMAPGFAGANPGGNFNPSYFGFNDYQSPMSQFSFGQGTPYCWIAQALYGENDPRVHRARMRLAAWADGSLLGRFVVGLYKRFGRSIATMPRVCNFLKPAFDALSAV